MRSQKLLLCTLIFVGCAKDPNKPQPPPDKAEPAKPASASQAAKPGDAPKPMPTPPRADDIPAPPDVAAPPADAEKTKTGLATKVLKPGTGADRPKPQDEVTVSYTGWTTDGKMFDASARHGGTATFPVMGVIKGWTEGLQLMVEGETRRMWIPVELAYNNMPGRPAGMLVFDVELKSIKKGPEPTPAPADVAGPPKDAQIAPGGLASKVVKPGTGDKHPKDTDLVTFDAVGWNSNDGTMIVNTTQRGGQVTRRVNELPPGLAEGLKLMVAGETRRMWIPPKLAVMRPGQPEPPNGMTFDVDLKTVSAPMQADAPELKAPADVAAAPADAEKSKTGLAWKVLTKGKGAEHPKATDRVKVQYIGWQTNGKMFDSSYTTGQPAEFQLDGVIGGWTEGVQLMVVGEKRRFWIPQELAYKGQEGPPKGLLVFDIELLDIVKAK